MRRHKKQASELRHDKRLLLRRGVTRDKITTYADNVGHEYNYLWIARVSSFCNVLGGCFRNGFPIVVSHLWYNVIWNNRITSHNFYLVHYLCFYSY